MITMNWFTLAVILFFVSFLSAYIRGRMAKKDAEQSVGELFVNPSEPADQGGVYAAFDADPAEFEDGQQVFMTVKVVRK